MATATLTSTGREVMICAILRMLLLTTLPSCSRRRRETGLFGVVARTCVEGLNVINGPKCNKRHRYDDIIMGFYDKAFDNSLQAKAAGSKPILFPANQNLGRSGLYHS